ncbi:MAG TPA: reverse transcriptase domain-containing protein [Polyangiaceae bacterium]|nr:reverse transcriptase domain-containing protein [Polyangiaceae bacterium]
MRASLFSPDPYLAQFERLLVKHRARHTRQEPESHGLTLSALQNHAPELCRRLAHDVGRGQYEFAPLSRVEVITDDKQRVIYRAELIDALVLGVMAQRLMQLLEPHLRDSVYAYRPERSPKLALTRLRAHLDEHRRQRPDPKQRGLFVLQRDLAAYGESIPTHSESRLWTQMNDVLAGLQDRGEARVLQSLLTRACRPRVRLASGEIVVLQSGLPTGSPIQQPLANLYLTPLDAALDEAGVSFYARFGDDLLLIEDDLARFERGRNILEQQVSKLELRFNPDKSCDSYFTAPGCPFSGGSGRPFTPARHIEYLGARVDFEGRFGLKRKRQRELLSRTRQRICNTCAVTAPEERLSAVARVVKAALFSQVRVADPLRVALADWVDDRAQLRQLDYLIARACAEAVSERRGVRALREVRPKDLRAAGLPSLNELRRRGASR